MDLYYSRRQIEVFLSVAEQRSMTRCAEELFLSQSAVSQIIKELERQCGVPLFDRIGRKLELSYAGSVLQEQFRRLSLIFSETTMRMESLAGLGEERLRLGASMTIGNYLMPGWLRDFHTHYPGIEISLKIDNTDGIQQLLLQNRLDAAVVEGPQQHELLTEQKLFRNPLHLILPAKHPWCHGREILAEELKDQRLIMREEGSGTRSVIIQELERRGISIRIAHTINNIEGIKRAVETGLGLSFLPEIAVKEEVQQGRLSSKSIKDLVLSRDFRSLRHRDKSSNPAIEAWEAYLSSVAMERAPGSEQLR